MLKFAGVVVWAGLYFALIFKMGQYTGAKYPLTSEGTNVEHWIAAFVILAVIGVLTSMPFWKLLWKGKKRSAV